MNFKFNNKKIIVSIIISLVILIFLVSVRSCEMSRPPVCKAMFKWYVSLGFSVLFGLVSYSIYSFFEKEKKEE